MKVELHKITPELVRELSETLERDEIRSLIRSEVRQLSDNFKSAKQVASDLLARCQIRAIKLANLGVRPADIAEMFDEDVKVVKKWITSDIHVPLTTYEKKGG